MPWGIFSAALLVVFVLQTALVSYVIGPESVVSLDLFLVLAGVCALAAPVQDARIGAWIVGLAHDLGSAGSPIGVHALSLGVLALLLTRLREILNQRIFWARAAVAFVAALAAQAVLLLHGALQTWLSRSPTPQPGRGDGWAELLVPAALTALAAAILAALVTQLPCLPAWRDRRSRRYSSPR